MRSLRMGHTALLCCLVVFTALFASCVFAQTDSGTVAGRVVDPAGLSVGGAHVRLIDIDRDTAWAAATNSAGLYTFHAVHPGRYRMEVEAKGFKVVNVTGLIVNTQAQLEQNFALAVGSVSESVTVEAKASDTSISVSTVVDRQFVENLPLNGRSFQSLIQLSPGVVVTPTTDEESGQFSVNGQRASANYFTVDGVSANIGSSFNPFSTQNAAGTAPGLSVLGGTNNLVSVDALQEFRIQTSTYAPEFGRTPGAQVSIETRSGTNQFHGTLFEYLRNDILDASNWFNGAVSSGPPLKKSQERQNDFGGVLGGPLLKNRTFFFVSYEGQILRLPRTSLSKVPSIAVRRDQATSAEILPLLNAYPLPNQPADPADAADQIAPFNASFSDRSTLNAISLRIDHKVNDRLTAFGRFNYSPSDLQSRGVALSLGDVTTSAINTKTLTVGAVWAATPRVVNDLRLNYSQNRAKSSDSLDTFGGAVVPSQTFLLPAQISSNSSAASFSVGRAGSVRVGPLANNLQRQFNLVDGVSAQQGGHALKFGLDYRRLSPDLAQPDYSISTGFSDIASATSLTPSSVLVQSRTPTTILFHNLGAYAQDTWKATPRLTLTYGLRWDVDFVPKPAHGPGFLALVNVNDPVLIDVAAPGTAIFHTSFHNVAPRVGAAYTLFPGKSRPTLLKGGFGVFYDLASQQTADIFSRAAAPPFGAVKFCSSFLLIACGSAPSVFPLPPELSAAPPTNPDGTAPVTGFDPALGLPYTLQWNAAVEQSLGDKESISLTYLGSIGRGLIQQQEENTPARSFGVIGNHATSDYHALQMQFRRSMSRGLQMLASYSWSHSIDTASASGLGFSNVVAGEGVKLSRASSGFDIRHSFSGGITYQIPAPPANPIVKKIFGRWAMDSLIQGRSAVPVDVFDNSLTLLGKISVSELRPDLVPGQPVYLTGAACGTPCPGGKALNPNAFIDPPIDPITFAPLRQGNVGRNAFRGFGALQWDFAARREFGLGESRRLEFRAELFNVLNHPSFSNPVGDISSAFFGRSIQTLNQGLNGATVGAGGFNPLYQIGGPRSGQLTLKLQF